MFSVIKSFLLQGEEVSALQKSSDGSSTNPEMRGIKQACRDPALEKDVAIIIWSKLTDQSSAEGPSIGAGSGGLPGGKKGRGRFLGRSKQ